MRIDEKRARLLALIRERSLQIGTFVLRSGGTSSYFLDGKQTTLSAEGAALVGELIFERLRGRDVQAVGGLTLGADPIATAVAIESWRQGQPIDAFIVRKETKDHGMGDRIAGALPPRARVAIVEDVVTTGGASQEAIDAVRAAGHTVVTVITVVDRLAGAAARFERQGLAFEALYTLRDLGIDPASA